MMELFKSASRVTMSSLYAYQYAFAYSSRVVEPTPKKVGFSIYHFVKRRLRHQ
jgi:hypothetical protein